MTHDEQPAVPDGEPEVRSDATSGTGPAHATLPPHTMPSASPVEAFNAVNPSGGPALEVDPPDDDGTGAGSSPDGDATHPESSPDA